MPKRTRQQISRASNAELPEEQSSKFGRLYFGKDDAERDFTTSGLLREGFLETSIYTAAHEHKKTLVIGRKGSGKSAICLMLHESLRQMPGKLSTIVSPDAISAEEISRFGLAGITGEQAKKLIWRYVFLVQISKFIIEAAKSERDKPNLSDHVRRIRQFLVDNGEVDDLKFHEKFWRIINKIKASISLKAWGTEVKLSGEKAAEGIRAGTVLENLDDYLKDALQLITCCRFYLFVDKVDEIWTNDRGSDQMIIGLLMAAKEVNEKFPGVTVIVFLRGDIYDMLVFHDRDKLRGDEGHIKWTDEELQRLLLARANASTKQQMSSDEFWTTFFPPRIDGVPVSKYLTDRTLKRPRDIIQFCNLCVDKARIRGCASVTEKDVKDALEVYSNWKLQDLIAEYKVNYPFLNDLLILFSNTSYVLQRSRIQRSFDAIVSRLKDRYLEHSESFTIDAVLNILYNINFLGAERSGGVIYYYDDQRTIEAKDQRLIVHPAFRNALKLELGIDANSFFDDEEIEIQVRQTIGEIGRGRSPIRGYFEPVRGFRTDDEVPHLLDRLSKAIEQEGLPEEVSREIKRGIGETRTKIQRARDRYDSAEYLEVLAALRKYALTMNKRLTEHELLQPESEASVILRRIGSYVSLPGHVAP